MEGMESKLESFYSAIEYFDLKPLYDIGKSHKKDEVDYIDISGLSQDNAKKIQPLLDQLYGFFETSHQKFIPFFIEISLYEPSDETGKNFYSLLLSKYPDVFDKYEDQMRFNLISETFEGKPRGVIIPNPNLYNFSYFFKRDFKHTFMVPENSGSNFKAQFGHFTEKDPKADYPKAAELEITIDDFFEETIKAFSKISTIPDGRVELNTAILIPLYRPASTIESKYKDTFKGGGVFLYGHTKPDSFNKPEFILQLKTLFLKSIFKQSFSQIEGERIKERSTLIELNTYHHLRNNLQHLPEYLGKIKDAVEKLPPEIIKSEIETVQRYITHLLNNSLYILKSYKNVLTTDSEDLFGLSSLGRLFDKLQNEEWIYLKETQKVNIGNKIDLKISDISDFYSKNIAVSSESLYGIIVNYIQNVIQAYLKENTTLQDLTVSINISEVIHDETEEHLRFCVFNSGTRISDSILNSLGVTPNPSSENSSGLGFYFLNSMLNFLKCRPDEKLKRYFYLSNTETGVEFSFDIKIYKND